MSLPIAALVVRARHSLGLTQKELAERLRSSERSVQRWETKGSTPNHSQVHWLADAVESLDPSLAADLDAWAPRPPAQQPPAPPPPPDVPAPPLAVRTDPAPPPSPVLAAILVDSVVCAAADAMSLPPHLLRPALAAALARAREAGLTLETLTEVLGAAKPEPLAEVAPAPGHPAD